MEQVSIARAVAREYDRRRQQTETEREQRRLETYRLHPVLHELDRAIAAAGADQLLEVIDPHRPQQARQIRQQLLDQRAELLTRFGIDADFDQVRPICLACRDSGVAGQRRCDCYRQILVPLLTAQANLRSLAGMHFENFDETLFSDEVDAARYKSEHSPRAQIVALRRICEAYVARFDQLEQRNLLFVGPPGTGKTYLMACVANALLAQGRSVLYVSAPALFEIMGNYRTQLASFHPDEIRFEQATALHDLVLNSELLLVDDLGTEPAAASRYADLLAIIDHRAGAGRHTLISSNADPGALRETYDERLLSRLLGSFAIYRFFGPDVRLVLSRRRRG